MRKLLSGLTIALFFISHTGCRNVQSAKELGVDIIGCEVIDVGLNPQIINFSEVIKDAKYIPLETSENFLVGEIDKIAVYDSDYYILDRRLARSLYRFDANGKFLNKFGMLGRGPGEYLEATDFIVNSEGVIILDHYGHNFLYYDHDGNYIKAIPFPYIIYQATNMPNDSLIFVTTGDNRHIEEAHNYSFLILDPDMEMEIVASGLYDEYKFNYNPGYRSFSYNDAVIYSAPLDPVIYEINDRSIKEKYRINILESPLPENFKKECKGDFETFMDTYETKHHFYMGKAVENDSWLLFLTNNRRSEINWNLYNKQTKNVYSSKIGVDSKQGITTDNFLAFGLMNCMTTDGEDFIGYLGATYFDGIDNDSISGIQLGDNPVLFHFKFDLPIL